MHGLNSSGRRGGPTTHHNKIHKTTAPPPRQGGVCRRATPEVDERTRAVASRGLARQKGHGLALAGLVGSGRPPGEKGRKGMVVRGAGGTHRRAEGRRRRPQEQLLELTLQVLQALPLALLLREDGHMDGCQRSTSIAVWGHDYMNNGERVLTAGPVWLMASRISPRISPAPCERIRNGKGQPVPPRARKISLCIG
ncbi:hypothetical protein C2845_PM13G19110 [Panicum miliaceum]|uniref:Uncharacterized protein n=1 Tax=Panicum miliaceum TaxID=4540 RepID=A0A3L6RNI4_PANMI|nr:hypothetical protein C2845_PM13G19110 [Panicum miliaceum]